MNVAEICNAAPVIPVVTITDPGKAVALAQALVDGGLPVIEITLRSDAAIEAIRRIARDCPDAIVGAGSIRTVQQAEDCRDAGAIFGVSPGAPRALAAHIAKTNWPFLPGCATATEAMNLAEQGFDIVKFFPAEAIGGIPALKSLAGPLPGMRFCPTGGITPENAAQYLSLENVVCVGGSWLTPADLIMNNRWTEITMLARAASDMAPAKQ